MSKYTNAIRMLAKQKALDADNTERLLNAHVEEQDGGAGSGNFGHKGRPGKRGGSAPKNGGVGTGNFGHTGRPGERGGFAPKSGGSGLSGAVSSAIRKFREPSPGTMVSSTKKPMTYEKGETPPFLKKAESPKGVGLGEGFRTISKYMPPNKQKPSYTVHFDPVKEYDPKAVEKALREWKRKTDKVGEIKSIGSAENWKDMEKAPVGSMVRLSNGKTYVKGENQTWTNSRDDSDSYESAEFATALQGSGAKIDAPTKVRKAKAPEENIVFDPAKEHDPSLPPNRVKYGNTFKEGASSTRRAIEVQRRKAVDWAKKEAVKFPEGSPERKDFEKARAKLEAGFGKRPTPEESVALIHAMGSNISKQMPTAATNAYKKALENEPKITSDMCDIADELGVGLYDLKNRIKSCADDEKGECRVAVKYNEYLEVKDDEGRIVKRRTPEEAAGELKDLVRYTFGVSHDTMGDDAAKVLSSLQKKGYNIVKCNVIGWDRVDPTWPYRGINCCVEKDGVKSEVQFHSPESYGVKNAMHGKYKIARSEDERVTQEQKDAANAFMYPYYNAMKVPRGLEKLKAFSKKV